MTSKDLPERGSTSHARPETTAEKERFSSGGRRHLILLRGIALFHALGCPILLGASRKRFIGMLGGGEAGDRLGGSVAVALFAARRGVQILRVHDIFATRQALDLEWAIGGAAMT